MGSGLAGAELQRQLNTLVHLGVVGPLSDGQLLTRVLVGDGEPARAAFTVLVERHGPMVLRVCRQVLGDDHDADDAFQATFLVLARRARSVRKAESVASWLHGVARRVSVRARADASRRRTRERRGTELRAASEGAGTDHAEPWSELHDEIARLPQRYREPVVLCYFEGLSTEAAAVAIGCPQGTVLSRLARARDRLRGRLARRGVGIGAGVAGGLIAGSVPATVGAAVPAALLEATVAASLNFARHHATATALASAGAVTLARGVLHAMTLSKLVTLTAVTFAGALAISGLALGQLGSSGGDQSESATKTASAGREAELTRKIEKLQAELAHANRRNTELQAHFREIQAVLNQLPPQGTTTTSTAVRDDSGSAKATSKRVGVTAEATKKMQMMAPGMMPGMPAMPGMMGMSGMMQGMPGMGMPPMMPGAGYGPAVGGGAPAPAGGETMVGNIAGMPGGTGAARPGRPQYMHMGDLIIAASANGDKVQLYNLATGRAHSVGLPASKEAPLRVTPILGSDLLALDITGPSITRIAVASQSPKAFGDWEWHAVDLREPVKHATPIVGMRVVAYGLGRHVYAYSLNQRRWDVAELPEGLDASPVVHGQSVTVEGPGHIFTFNAASGKWQHVDIERLFEDAENDEPAPEPNERRN